MKLCLINSVYPPLARGGAEVVVERVVEGLRREGHHVVLITLGRTNEIEQLPHLTIHRITVLNVFSFLDINRWPVWVRLIWHPVDMLNVFGYRKIRAILQAERPDAVLTHNLKGIGYLVPAAIRSLGLRHIHTLHDVQLSRPSGLILVDQDKPFVILDKLYEKICKKLFGNPQVVVSPSNWLLQYYRRRGFFYTSQSEVLPNPVVFQHPPRVKCEPFDGVTLLYVGQLERSKGILFLLDAILKLKGNWRLLIAGTGTVAAEVGRRAAHDSRIVLLGWIDPHKLSGVYAQADCTVVPSLCYENSPTVISESLVANVPVIAADIGGISELVHDGENGFTFAPGNESSAVEVLQYFIDHPEQFERLRKNCFTSVRQHSLDRYLRQLLEFVRSEKS